MPTTNSSLRAQCGLASLQRTMAAAGWEILFVDLDLTGERSSAEVKLMRADGRWLWAKCDQLGRCTTETFQRSRHLGMAEGQRGRRPLVPVIEDQFMGRDRHTGPRAMLRYLTRYLADNAASPVALVDMRRAWAGIMQTPTLITSTA